MTGTSLQITTMVAHALFAAVCVWAMRRRRATRPLAAAGLSWALNGLLFYVVYLGPYGGVLTETLIAWSAITRLHGIFLAAGGILVTSRRVM